MPYSLQYKMRVVEYLRDHEGLARADRIKLFAILDSDLREQGDFYVNDPERRIAVGPDCFWFDVVLMDEQRQLRRFRFVVNAAPAKYGVLRIEYVDEG